MADKMVQAKSKEESLAVRGKQVEVGGIFLDNRGELYKVLEISWSKHAGMPAGGEWQARLGHRWGDKWGSYGSHSVSYWENERYIYLGAPPEGMSFEDYRKGLTEDALEAIRNPESLGYQEDVPDNSTSALAVSAGPEKYKSMIEAIEDKRIRAQTVEALIKARVSEVTSLARGMKEQIEKLMKIVGVLELYLGIEEQIVQIADGTPAPADEQIAIRQLVLFMDEEVGDPMDHGDGIDFTQIEDFDRWAVDNIDKLVPETKGIVACRPSRQKRWHYTFLGEVFSVQENDRRCYLLIRNGEKLWRIFTGLEGIGTHFIPSEKELLHILEKINEGWGSGQREAEEAQLNYSRNALLVQGLIDRTDLFRPFDARPDVLSGTDPLINFIYDGGDTLPDGRLPFQGWKDYVNSKIVKGTRIVIGSNMGRSWGADSDFRRGRMLRYYTKHGNMPPAPKPGVYNVYSVLEADHAKMKWKKDGVIGFVIRYNPKDEVYADWYRDYHERRNAVSFVLYSTDDFVFNYDLVDLDAVEFYEQSRIERPSYLSTIPVLREMKWNRRREIGQEKDFVALVSIETENSEADVWRAVEWWKKRTEMVRPLDLDDKKAWRMIRRHLKGAWKAEVVK